MGTNWFITLHFCTMGRTQRRRLRLKNNTLSNPDNTPCIIALKKWMHNNNWKNESRLQLAEFENTGRGLTSSKNISKLDVLIQIPYNLMITYTTLENSSSFKAALVRKPVGLRMHDLLAMFLVLERHKGASSFWYAYVDSLPVVSPLVSWLCSAEDINSIFDDELKAKTTECLESFISSWGRCSLALSSQWTCECCGRSGTDIFTYNLFIWAYAMVNTRSVYVDPNVVYSLTPTQHYLVNKPCLALCPFLDMFNHSNHAKTEAILENIKGEWVYKLITYTSFKKRNEIFISYGAHDNIKLVCEYGFFIPDQSMEMVKLNLNEIVELFNFTPSARQLSFVTEKRLANDLHISSNGASFNLKALLFVLCNPNTRNWSGVIYNSNVEESQLLEQLDRLVKFKADRFSKGLLNLEVATNQTFSTVLGYLKFKLNYMSKLLKANELVQGSYVSEIT